MTAPEPAQRSRLRVGLLVALVVVLALLCCGGVATSFFLGNLDGNSDSTASLGCGGTALINPNDDTLPRVRLLGDEQTHNAAVIIRTGQDLQVPPRGWVIAIATALQESWLRNLGDLGANNDHDSLGIFQQRPSQGWGTAAEVMDPAYSSRKFYEKLLAIPGWETLALTDAAQRVQISAYPDAYAKHEPLATTIVNVLADGAARAVGSLSALRCVSAGEISASGWTVPLPGEIVSGFRTAERPVHDGVDLAAARGTPVHAAAGGVVIRVRCNAVAPGGWDWGCDRDGSPSIKGCGWYIDIMHAASIITRYCHLSTRPMVAVGQQVAAGQQIGVSGTTGNSSGPHLHFEIHLNGDENSSGATNPVPFMQTVGAPLGVPVVAPANATGVGP